MRRALLSGAVFALSAYWFAGAAAGQVESSTKGSEASEPVKVTFSGHWHALYHDDPPGQEQTLETSDGNWTAVWHLHVADFDKTAYTPGASPSLPSSSATITGSGHTQVTGVEPAQTCPLVSFHALDPMAFTLTFWKWDANVITASLTTPIVFTSYFGFSPLGETPAVPPCGYATSPFAGEGTTWTGKGTYTPQLDVPGMRDPTHGASPAQVDQFYWEEHASLAVFRLNESTPDISVPFTFSYTFEPKQSSDFIHIKLTWTGTVTILTG